MEPVTSSGSGPDPAASPAPHYFDEEPGVRSRPTTVHLELPDRTVELTTDRGVFAADRIDPGTALLLAELAALDSGGRRRPEGSPEVVVDLGCGSGAIACVQALRHPDSRVLAVDVNRRARELCAANAAAVGADVEVLAPQDVPADLRVDHLVSNPPIRIGKPAVHALLGGWLDRLGPDGTAHLVVARHLGADSLATWMRSLGFSVERLRSRTGYRILEVRPPPD